MERLDMKSKVRVWGHGYCGGCPTRGGVEEDWQGRGEKDLVRDAQKR